MVDTWAIFEAVLVTAAFIAFGITAYYAFTRARRMSPDMLTKMQALFEREQGRANARIDALELEIEDLREAIADSHEEVTQLRDGIAQLVTQIRAANMIPVWEPDRVVKRKRTTKAGVARKLEDLFSLDEIASLAFEFGLSPDELTGDTRATKARAFVIWASERNRLPELRRRIDELRPEGRPGL